MARPLIPALAVLALLMTGHASAQQGARVTVTSMGQVTVEPDRYEYRIRLRLDDGAETIETAASALASRLRETLLAEKVASGSVAATAEWRPASEVAAAGEERLGRGEAELIVGVSAADAGAPNERISRLAALREALNASAQEHVAQSADSDQAGLTGPFPALIDDTASRQAAIGSAVKTSAADAEAAAAALQGRVVSAESVEVGAVTLKWSADGTNDRLRFQGEITARAKVTYLIGAAR